MMKFEYEWVRDFIILHYKATERADSPFWNYCREMEVPPSRWPRACSLFQADGRVFREGEELFSKMSWIQVMHGQRMQPGVLPSADRPVVRGRDRQVYLDEVSGVIGACVDVMPTHEKFIAEHCAAGPVKPL